MNPDRDLAHAVSRLEARLRRVHLAWGVTTLAACVPWLASFVSPAQPDVLRVRGIVVEDSEGKPRILIGAPIPDVSERSREDAATGLVLLDASGADRLQIGEVGGPMLGGRVQPRIADALGLMVCDPAGNERAGFGYLANGQVGWGLDYPTGEAIVAAVLPDRGVAGIFLNAPVTEGNPTRAMLMTSAEVSGLRLSDGNGRERAVFEVGGLGSPALRVLGPDGDELRDALAENR